MNPDTRQRLADELNAAAHLVHTNQLDAAEQRVAEVLAELESG
jgi:hypothetical protein